MNNTHLFLGSFVVGLSGVATASTSLDLVGGDRVAGEVVAVTPDGIVLCHEVLGELLVPHASIVRESWPSRTPASPPPVDAPGRSAIAGQVERQAQLEASGESQWNGSFGVAMTASQTTSNTYNVRLSGHISRSDDSEKTEANVTYYLNQAGGEITDNDVLARGSQNWYVPDSPWEVFCQSTYQFDAFEEWTHRVSPYGGFGYRIFDDEKVQLTLKGGGGATWEYGTGSIRPQAILESEADWKLTDRQSIKGYASIAPNVQDPSDYLATIKCDWQIRLGHGTPLALSIGVRDIYDSTPGSGATHNDLKAWAGLTVDF